MSLTYREAGVDIDAGERFVEAIKPLAKATRIPEQLDSLGGFAGCCALPTGMREPVLVSGTDGVGTKLKIAFELDDHRTVGIDLVAMCVNDIATVGARPLFFLDYFGTGKLSVEQATQVVSGIAEGCKQAGCALLGGETAELPGFYAAGEYDLAGFVVGVAERAAMLPKTTVHGDVIIGLDSSGLHSNGFSLARRALQDLDKDDVSLGAPLYETLLTPTTIYAQFGMKAAAHPLVRAMSHVTGGGLPGNLPRVLQSEEPLAIRLNSSSWKRHPVFELVQTKGDIADGEMLRTFNMGIGFAVFCHPDAAKDVCDLAAACGHRAQVIGEVSHGTGFQVV